jgi:hypothetical protein
MAQLGLGGDISTAYNPKCAAGFGHSSFDSTLHGNLTLNMPLILCVRLTLDVLRMLMVTHFIHVRCMWRVLLLLHVPLMLIVTHFFRVSCILYVLCMLPMFHMLHTATRLVCAPYVY